MDVSELFSVEYKDDSFWVIWARHKNSIKMCCIRWLNGNYSLAEDALSIIVEKATSYLSGRRYEIENYFSWLYKLSYHVCIDIHRDLKKQLELVNEVTRLPGTFFFSQCESESMEDQFVRQDALESLLIEMGKLPEETRLVLIFRFIDEMPYAQIADVLSITEANARKRVQLGRKTLRDTFDRI